jgi:catechol 2,3-dioxygenase-like lactoylglutathione lyase family enzyme
MTAPLWPARLHHLRRDSADPERLARFYGELLGDRIEKTGTNEWLVGGRGRLLVIGKGEKAAVPYYAFEVHDRDRLKAYRGSLEGKGLRCEELKTPLMEHAFQVRDPDDRRIAFGLPLVFCDGEKTLPGRLQHFVCATTRLDEMTRFYRDTLGLLESDRVLEGEALSAAFLRSDPEHHSFAAFRAPEARPDHHCYETGGWNDIRDWGDRMAALRIPLWWGPGRHGPGNNLFFMIEDPDGHKVEFSAELEVVPRDVPFRTWPHEQRTLNLWGSAWMRS